METQQSIIISSLQEPETREKAFKLLVQEYKERLYWHIRKLVLVIQVTQEIFAAN